MHSVRSSAIFLVRVATGRGGRRGLPEDDERSGDSLAAEMESRRAHLNRVLDPEAPFLLPLREKVVGTARQEALS